MNGFLFTSFIAPSKVIQDSSLGRRLLANFVNGLSLQMGFKVLLYTDDVKSCPGVEAAPDAHSLPAGLFRLRR